jgi:hypothetical protein
MPFFRSSVISIEKLRALPGGDVQPSAPAVPAVAQAPCDKSFGEQRFGSDP